MAEKMTADPNKIYVIRFPGDEEASEIVMNVETERKGFSGICYLTPPDHGHMIQGHPEKLTKDGFIFMSTGYMPGKWEFTELTYDSFREKYYKLVYGGEQLVKLVHNTRELQDYYHENFPDYT